LAAFLLRQSAYSATPLLLAGYGELLAERAGVINVGIEGTMLLGTIAGFGGAVWWGTAGAALPAAAAAGLLTGALFALVSVWLRADQIVAGTAINLMAAGISTTAWRMLQGYMARGHAAPALFEPQAVPGLAALPVVGALFDQYGLFYAVVLIGAALYGVLRWTRLGLVIQALGDAPEACHAAGISVRGWRTALLLLAGAASGVAGAYLSTMRGHSFQINMTDGQGFLVLALVIFGRWRLWAFAAGTLAFGVIDALQAYLAASGGATAHVPHQLFTMLPYAATLLALALLPRRNAGGLGGAVGPLQLGRPWPE
jgi:simple sugar transport system permease protein